MWKSNLLIVLIFFPWCLEAKSFTPSEVGRIIESVGPDASTKFISLLSDKRLRKTDGMVDFNITKPIKLSMEKYSHFTDPYASKLAKKFHKKWRKQLSLAQKRYKVDARVITSILLVETSFGRFTGNYQPLSVFASILVDVDTFKEKQEYRELPNSQKERVERKQAWAVRELKAISNLTKKYPSLDILKIKGSYAGAFGKCQFLPSSYLAFAVSHRSRKVPNLFDEKDAILSVANYLVSNGYKHSMDSKGSYDSIYHYNNSDVYVKTVLAVAKKLNKLP